MKFFTEADLQSATWRKLKKHFEERLADYRVANDNTLSDLETVKLRGRIAELKYMLDLAKPDPEIPAE